MKFNQRFGGKYRLHLQGRRVSQTRNQHEAGSRQRCFKQWVSLHGFVHVIKEHERSWRKPKSQRMHFSSTLVHTANSRPSATTDTPPLGWDFWICCMEGNRTYIRGYHCRYLSISCSENKIMFYSLQRRGLCDLFLCTNLLPVHCTLEWADTAPIVSVRRKNSEQSVDFSDSSGTYRCTETAYVVSRRLSIRLAFRKFVKNDDALNAYVNWYLVLMTVFCQPRGLTLNYKVILNNEFGKLWKEAILA
jgi:hypothetical protein